MTDSVNDWVSRLSAEPLPVLRCTLTRVKDQLRQASTSHHALSSTIRHDPAFCLHVFRHLNSLPRRPRQSINKIGNVIPLLGMGLIEQATQILPSLEAKLKEPHRLGLIDCYSRAAHASIYAADLAARQAQRDPEHFATAALLHDIGEMALWSSAPQLMGQLQKRMAQGERQEDAALGVLGFTLEELNLKLGEAWHLPSLAQESQRSSNSYRPQPLTVMMAVALSRISTQHWDCQETHDQLELLAEILEIPQIRAQSQFHQLVAAAARELQHLPLPFQAFHLVLANAESVRPAEKPMLSEPVPSAADNEKKGAGLTKTPAQSAPKHSTLLTPPRASNPVQEKLIHLLREMKTHHGLQRVMFAMLTTDKKQLKARFVLDNGAQTSLKGLLIDLQKPSLFVALLKKPQAVWINSVNQKKYRSIIPPAASQAMCDTGFMLMSVFLKHRPIGFLYADGGCGDEALSAGQYENFKALCQQLMKDLS